MLLALRGLLIALIAFISCQTSAIESEPTKTYALIPTAVSTDLKKSTVLRVLKDQSGAIWFYTFEGLAKYDGKSIRNFGFPKQLKNVGIFSDVISLIESRDGSISIVTKDGIYPLRESESGTKLRLWTEKLANEYGGLNVAKPLSSNRLLLGFLDGTTLAVNPQSKEVLSVAKMADEFVTSVEESPSGSHYVMTNQGKFYLIHADDFIADAIAQPSDCQGVDSIFSHSLVVSESRFISATESGEVLDIDLNRNRCQKIHLKDKSGANLQRARIHALAKVKGADYVVIGTDSGLHGIQISASSSQNSLWDAELPSTEVTSLMSDPETGIWVGTYRGLSLLTRSSILVRLADQDPHLSSIMSISAESKFGTIIATYNQILTSKETRALEAPLPMNVPKSVRSKGQIMATAASSSEIIIGYRTAGLLRYNVHTGHTASYTTTSSPSLSSNQVSALLVASSGDLYVGTYGGGVNVVRDGNQISTIRSGGLEPSLPSDNVILLTEDSQGKVWFGTEAGLVRFDPASNSVKQVFFDTGDDIQSFVAWCLALTSEDKILAGTPANGIYEVKSVKGEKLMAKRISKDYPLDSISIFSLETSGDDSIWASTSNAIWHIYDDNTKAIRYGASAGLGSLEFDLAVSAKDSQGNLYFGGSNGYAVFNPADMDFERKPSPMLLTGLDIAGDTSTPAMALPYLSDIEISYRDRFITFMFNVIDYFDSSQNRYRYMLEGFDPDWVEAGDRDSATFTNLPAGHYVFRAQGSNSDGVWNREGIRINLVVHAAPWRTWWAYALYFLLLAGLIWSLKKTYDTYMLKEKATAMAENMNRAVEDAMDDIQEQLENQDTLVRRFHQRNLDTLGLISHLQAPDWPRRHNGNLPALEALESTLSYQGDQLLFDLQACINLIVAKVLAANPTQAGSLNTILDVPNVFLSASLGSYLAIALYEIADDTVANSPAESSLGNYIQIAISMTEDSSINLTVQSSYSADPSNDTAPPSTTRKAHRLLHLERLLKTIGASLDVDENQYDRVVAIIPQTALNSQVQSPE